VILAGGKNCAFRGGRTKEIAMTSLASTIVGIAKGAVAGDSRQEDDEGKTEGARLGEVISSHSSK
jgi:hypothetical protein